MTDDHDDLDLKKSTLSPNPAPIPYRFGGIEKVQSENLMGIVSLLLFFPRSSNAAACGPCGGACGNSPCGGPCGNSPCSGTGGDYSGVNPGGYTGPDGTHTNNPSGWSSGSSGPYGE